jgi:hypothetical protein
VTKRVYKRSEKPLPVRAYAIWRTMYGCWTPVCGVIPYLYETRAQARSHALSGDRIVLVKISPRKSTKVRVRRARS